MDSLPSITVIDAAVAGVLLLSALLAFARGFVHEVLAVAGWVGAIFAAIYGFPHLQPYARDIIPMKTAADLTAGAIVFLVTLVVLSLLTTAVSKRVQDSALNALDRSLGFLFGLARGAVILCLIYIGIEVLLPKKDHPDWLTEARTLPLIEEGAGWLRTLLPESMGGRTDSGAAGRIMETGRTLENLLSPEPRATPPKDGDGGTTGYSDAQRKALDRLLQGGGK